MPHWSAGSSRRPSLRVPKPPQPAEGILRSRQNPRVQEARRLARDSTLARGEGVLVADGVRIVLEALRAGLVPRLLLVDPSDPNAAAIRQAAESRDARVTLATAAVLDSVSTLTTPQGALGVFERPAFDLAHVLAAPDAAEPPLICVLHGLQDPANAGSLVRSALATGLAGMIATAGTVDPYHPRSVRASMGGCFRLPVIAELAATSVWEMLNRGGYRILALEPRGGLKLDDATLDRPTAIVLGREGSGLDSEARDACEASVRIPMTRAIESLGVAAAGAIVFYMLAGRRIR